MKVDLKPCRRHFNLLKVLGQLRKSQDRWDPLAIIMDNKQKCSQKLDYIHTNPLQERWSLAAREEDYAWSSARFYFPVRIILDF